MRYVMMIYVDETIIATMSDDERNTLVRDYAAFHQEVNQRQIWDGGAPLQPTNSSTSVQMRDGKALITDGPFAETKEQLAGVYILHCDNLDDAIEWAKKIPDVKYGTIEIRPANDIY